MQFEICSGRESRLRYQVPSKVIKVKLFMRDFRKKLCLARFRRKNLSFIKDRRDSRNSFIENIIPNLLSHKNNVY